MHRLERSTDWILSNRPKITFIVFFLILLHSIYFGRVSPKNIKSLTGFWGLTGIILVIAGVGLRSWAAGILHKNKTLATTGPYALTRHPLYVGALLMAVGFCVFIGGFDYLIVVVVFTLVVYYPKLMREETAIRKQFGPQWDSYSTYTSILFPKRISAGSLLTSHWSMAQWYNNREYCSPVVAICVIIAIVLYRHMFF